MFCEHMCCLHGENAEGIADFGAPNLADFAWVGGDLQTILASVHGGRQATCHMGRSLLIDAEIRTAVALRPRSWKPGQPMTA